MNVNINSLIKWNRRGIFPGENETLSSFQNRLDRLIPQLAEISEVPSYLVSLCDINPSWAQQIPKKLPFWCGAYVEFDEDSSPKVYIPSKRSWGPSIKELIAHELIHVARAPLNSDAFEEILAHTSNPYSWRQKLGSAFSSSFSRSLLLTLIFLPIIYNVALLFWDLPLWGPFTFLMLTLTLLSYELIRAFCCWKVFFKALSNIKELVGDTKLWAVMIRLSDQEIDQFSKASQEEIFSYFAKASIDEIRKKLIFEMYLKKKTYAEMHFQDSVHSDT